MSLAEEVGQLLVPGVESSYLPTDSDGYARIERAVRDQHIGGVIVFGGAQSPPGALLNSVYGGVVLGQPLAAAATLNRLQAAAKVPLLVAADFESGVGMRMSGGTGFPRAMAFGAAGDTRLVEEAARFTAREARAIGIHLNLAPVSDVNNNPRNPVINARSFGEAPGPVAAMVSAYVRGLQTQGMLATLKHFPGHGDTDVDSHLGLPLISHPRSRFDAFELPPFCAGIEAGAAAVMTSHIVVPGLDPRPDTPATFSAPVTTTLLRRELGFGGLVLTDSMQMAGLAAISSPGDAAVRAILAGHDLLIDVADPEVTAADLTSAVARGEITVARIDESVRRILRAKARLGLHRRRLVGLDAVSGLVGSRAAAAVAEGVSRRSITLLNDERGSVPLQVPASASVLYLSVLDNAGGWSGAAPSRVLVPELRKRWPQMEAVELSDRTPAAELDRIVASAGRYDAIVVAVFVRTTSGSGRMDLPAPQAGIVRDIARATREARTPMVTVFFGNPYVATSIPGLPAMLLTYEVGDLAERSAARAITGAAVITGHLPIRLAEKFPLGYGIVR